MRIFSILFSFCFYLSLTGQVDTIKPTIYTFGGSISANTNGFSLIPTFSLGKPALQTGFNFATSKSRLSFHPQIWYSLLDYKPWSLIFIWRYKVINKDKFSFIIGAHAPAINYKSATVIDNGAPNDVVKARRFYPTLELIPTYKVNKTTSIGLYYLFGVGIEKEVATVNNFISLRADFNRINVSKNFYLRFNPQLYFLSIDSNTGIYVAGSLTVAKKNFPLNISSNFNKAIKSCINANPFAWNIGVNYEFTSQFIKK
ncbi:MAG: hypothetical protein WAT26_17255 [Saprospiraceae bacterium]